jgi:hydrogenase/urease accessory protein HupE
MHLGIALGCALALVAGASRGYAQTPDRSTQEKRVTSAAFLITYGTTYVVHAHEAWTTADALEAGARETNPLLAPFTSRPAMVAVGLARATAINVAVRSIGKRHKVAAIMIGAALNFGYLSLAEHNRGVAADMRKQRRRLDR